MPGFALRRPARKNFCPSFQNSTGLVPARFEVKDAYLVPAESDRVVPKGFYTTSNHPTQVKYGGEWLPVESIEMDFLIVVDPVKKCAVAVALGKIRKGDLVVVGEQGVSVSYP